MKAEPSKPVWLQAAASVELRFQSALGIDGAAMVRRWEPGGQAAFALPQSSASTGNHARQESTPSEPSSSVYNDQSPVHDGEGVALGDSLQDGEAEGDVDSVTLSLALWVWAAAMPKIYATNITAVIWNREGR